MAGKSLKPGSGGFDPSENVNSNTLKRHPKMDLSRNDLLQLLSYLEGELQARDIAIATLKAEKAKQLLYQAKYGRFGLGDPFSAMQRDSDNMKDNSFDESAIKCMYDNQLAQLENLIATQRKAQMKMREQMITSDKKYQKVCSELDEEKRKHAQDTAQGDDVTYMLEKERERLKQEVEFEKANVKKMEKDLKKTLASLEEERVNSGKHKQVALMLIKERKKLVEKYVLEKHNAEEAEKLLTDERTKAMNMAEGLVQESKKSLKMEATMERQLSEFDLEREQMRNKLLREENRNKDLQSQVESLKQQLESLQKQSGKSPKDSYHSVEIKSQITSPQVRLSSERTAVLNVSPSSTHSGKISNDANVIEREAGLSPRNSPSDLSVRKRDIRYASPQPSSVVQHHDSSLETRVAPVGAVSDRNVVDPHTLSKLNVSVTGNQPGPTVVSGGGRITVQTGSPTPGSGPVSPRRVLAIGRGVPPPIPPNKPVLTVTSANTKPVTQKIVSSTAKENRVALTPSGSKSVHIPVSVVHTSTVNTAAGGRSTKREGSPSSIRKPAQFPASLPFSGASDASSAAHSHPDSFDFLGPEMADLQQLLVSMVSVSPDSTSIETETTTANLDSISTSSSSSSSSSSLLWSSSSSPNTIVIPSNNSEPSPAIDNSILSITPLSAPYKFSTHVSAQSVPSKTLEPSSTSNILPESASPNITVPPPFQFTSSNPAFSTSNSAVVSGPAKAESGSAQYSSSTTSSSFTASSLPASFPSQTLSFSASPSINFATVSSATFSSSPLSSAPFTFNSSPAPFTASFPSSKPTNSSSSSALRSVKSPSTLKEDTSNFYPSRTVKKTSSRDERGLTPPTSCQMATDAWTAHQHGNKDLPFSPIHRYASNGNTDALRKLIIDLDADVNLPMKDGTTPCHCAAENGHLECLKLLMSRGGNINCLRDDQLTPVHCAAAQGHSQCLDLLLTHGGQCQITDQSVWTPLHWAAANGHLECCKLLIKKGAKRTALSATNWTPCHMAVQYGHVDCLDLLLTFESEKSDKITVVKGEITEIVDKDGWSLAHLAASKDSSDCLSVILTHCDIDVHCQDKLGRSVVDISSNSAYKLLLPHVNKGQVKHIPVEIVCTGSTYQQQQPYSIGHASLHPGLEWTDLYGQVVDLCHTYFRQIDRGLHSKKISRLDPENNVESGFASLGLDEDSIHSIELGSCSFNSETTHFPQFSPFEILANNNISSLCVKLKGYGGACSSLAFDLLMPVSTISNYVRLIEQYHSVIFYGPEGTRKKQLVKRLSHHLATKESHIEREVKVVPVYLHQDFTHRDFIQLLKDNGCLVRSDCSTNTLCILMLFHLEKVNFPTMFGSLLQHIDSRGDKNMFYLSGADNIQEAYYLSEYFYLIATMDKPRSIGLDLSLQQRFRWVNFCVNVEPIRNLLARHLLRRLIHTYGGDVPNMDDPVYKAVEWLVCVWQRLNDGVNKLGLQDVVFGPEMFLPCPLETKQPHSLYEWLKKVWNEVISTSVKSAIIKVKESDNQGKVTNTALYVLLQRVIVPGCPLTGKEKEDYLKDFQGSNELDIPLYNKPTSVQVASQRRPLYDSKRQADDEGAPAKTKHRNSIEGDGRFMFTKTVTASPNPKRRSLSDTYLTKTESTIEIPVIHHQTETNSFQSKVPKLEIRSPVLGLTVPMPASLKKDAGTNPLSNLTNSSEAPSRRSTFSTHSRIPTSISKRSRSSEVIARSQVQGRSSPFRPTSPFSFSLTTPTSSLFSFKFLDNNNSDEVSKQSMFNSARESQC